MTIPTDVETALNDQVNNELYSAYMYLGMATWFDSLALTGFSAWMQAQCVEELQHAQKLMQFLSDQDATITLKEIKAPPATFDDPLAALETALQAEQDNTEQINDIYELAVRQQDHATEVMMQWFIQEQVEEERSARTLIERVRLAGNDRGALLVLDAQLGERSAATG